MERVFPLKLLGRTPRTVEHAPTREARRFTQRCVALILNHMRIPAIVLLCTVACTSGDARVTAPEGAAAFGRFVSIGAGVTMGEQSAGVVYETQLTAWPAQLAARMDAPFRVPALRQPGCTPPLVAPLVLHRTIEGPVTSAIICSGKLGVDTLPANNVAISGATAWDALHTSPRTFAGLAASLDQSRYALVLPSVQTQVQAMRSQRPTLVAVELGAVEVLRAASSGLVVLGTSYTQKGAWTLMPASVFALVLDSIADSVAVTGARAVFLGVPAVMSLPAWRAGDVLWQQRTELATYGVAVDANCQSSANLVNTVALLPQLAAASRATGVVQALSCADQPGVADRILTASEAALIAQTVTAINAAIKAAADKRNFAYADTPLFSSEIPFAAPAFSAATFFGADQPFGWATSLDGVLPSAYGQGLLADAVASALNTKYGWKIPLPVRPR